MVEFCLSAIGPLEVLLLTKADTFTFTGLNGPAFPDFTNPKPHSSDFA